MSYCRFLNRQATSHMKAGSVKRMENVFRPFVCGDPHRVRAVPQELGASLTVAREECKKRCPARFGTAPAPTEPAPES